MEILPLLSLVLVVFIPLLLALTDYIIIVRSRLKSTKRKLPDIAEFTDDFTILIPIFGSMKYLKNVSFLKKYAPHVILCTTEKESREFNQTIRNLAEENHFRIFRSSVTLASNNKENNPLNLIIQEENNELTYNKDIARDEIIKDSFNHISTRYCLFLDGDTFAKDDLYHLFGLMERKKFDIASVRVLVAKRETLIQKLQAVEYDLSMDARKIYPWLTSGAATVGKTSAFRKIMKHHSLYFQGGDIEVGRLAIMMNLPVGHIPFSFYTDVPRTFRAWWKQRQAWFGGGFRHSVINFHSHGLKYPLFSFYNSVLVFFTLPLRWYEVIQRPMVIPIIIILYWVLILVFHWKEKEWYYIFFPFYSLLQIMVLVPLGACMYFKMSFRSQNVGLIKLRL